MPSISDTLAEVYNNTKQASHSQEDTQRVAEAQVFIGLCKQAGINPADLTDDQINRLWKAASDAPPSDAPAAEEKKEEKKEEPKDAEKKEAAAKEWRSKRDLQEKFAESDAMGRVMAHAYVDELTKISQGMPPQFMEKKEEPAAEEKKEAPPEEKKEEEEKKKESQLKAEQLIAKLAKHAGASSTPNLDEQAALQAIEMLKAAGVDGTVAYNRIAAAYTLGLEDSAKIANAQTPEDAQVIRALEFCEAAKFPVDWSKV